MQIFLCELVGKFSFELPAEGAARTCYAGLLQPTMANGKKGARLLIKHVV